MTTFRVAVIGDLLYDLIAAVRQVYVGSRFQLPQAHP
jgi:hypothetical protein